jgi:sulfoxide reductase heme-binding subunit YedZ
MTTWVLLRAAGIGSYLMLFLSVAWGLVATTSIVTKRISKPSANLFHAFVASTGLALLGVHLGLLLVDEFMPFSLADITVPMASDYRPVAIAAGIVAMYAVVIVVVSSWLRKPIGTVWWRRLHMLAVPAFTLALMHGVFAGTDTERPWMFALYAVTGLLVVFLTLVRALTYGYRPPRPAPPVRSRPTEPATPA